MHTSATRFGNMECTYLNGIIHLLSSRVIQKKLDCLSNQHLKLSLLTNTSGNKQAYLMSFKKRMPTIFLTSMGIRISLSHGVMATQTRSNQTKHYCSYFRNVHLISFANGQSPFMKHLSLNFLHPYIYLQTVNLQWWSTSYYLMRSIDTTCARWSAIGLKVKSTISKHLVEKRYPCRS